MTVTAVAITVGSLIVAFLVYLVAPAVAMGRRRTAESRGDGDGTAIGRFLPLRGRSSMYTASLSRMVRHATITPSDQRSATDPIPRVFAEFHSTLAELFPRTHSSLSRRVVSGGSLLFVWRGSNASLKPLALAAHMDVVPVAHGTESDWAFPPWDGAVSDDGFVYGRGTLDDKGSLCTILHAVEWLLESGFAPERTVVLAFGHQEEIGGEFGAPALVAVLREEFGELEAVIDEGGLIVQPPKGISSTAAAVVGVAEKGNVAIKLSCAPTDRGHASTPGRVSPISALSDAICKISALRRTATLRFFVPYLSAIADGSTPFFLRVLISHPYLFGGVLRLALSKSPASNALTRTTCVPTIFNAGDAFNILPAVAEATLNVRLMPGESIHGEVAKLQRVLRGSPISVSALPGSGEPSVISPVGTVAWKAIRRSVSEVFDGTECVPYLCIGGTDSRFYQSICKNIYRFIPVVGDAKVTSLMHGTNERIAVANLEKMVDFYVLTIVRASVH